MEEILEQVQSRHRKEQRELQSRITQKKKNATKKTRKGINDECAELERQLKERQDEELRQLTDPDGQAADTEDRYSTSEQPEPPSIDNELASRLASSTNLSEPPPPPPPRPTSSQDASIANGSGEGGGNKKRNRQKERLARRAAEVEAAAAAAAEEASGMTDRRGVERARMEPVFAARGLVEREVAPDGHCLFASFADGLAANGIEPSFALRGAGGREDERGEKARPGYKVVRQVAAGYMAAHEDEFAGFLEEPLGSYVERIRDTAEWGGQLELTALAKAYGVEVRVVQDGRTEVIAPGEETEGEERKVVWLAYYRHGYGLGEHYNSLRKKEGEP